MGRSPSHTSGSNAASCHCAPPPRAVQRQSPSRGCGRFRPLTLRRQRKLETKRDLAAAAPKPSRHFRPLTLRRKSELQAKRDLAAAAPTPCDRFRPLTLRRPSPLQAKRDLAAAARTPRSQAEEHHVPKRNCAAPTPRSRRCRLSLLQRVSARPRHHRQRGTARPRHTLTPGPSQSGQRAKGSQRAKLGGATRA